MSRGPADLTPRMGAWVFAGFLSGLVALLGYMALLALRLSRRAATAKPARQDRRFRRKLLPRMRAWRWPSRWIRRG